MALTLAQQEALSKTNTAVLNDRANTKIKADLFIQTDQKLLDSIPPTVGTTVTTNAVATLNGRTFRVLGATINPPEEVNNETLNQYQRSVQEALDSAYNRVLIDIQNAFGDEIEDNENIDLDIQQIFRTNITFPGPRKPDPDQKKPETPKQIQERRRRQREKDQAQEQSVSSKDPGQLNTNLPKDQQPSGQDKLNQLTVQKAINFVGANLGVIDQVLESLGLPNSQDLRDLQAQGEEAVREFIERLACANPELLKRAVEIRDKINEVLTLLGTFYGLTDRAINQLSDFVSGQINSTKLLKNLRGITSQASKIIPTPPGVPGIIPSTLSDVSAVVDSLIFSALGEPQIKKRKTQVDIGLMFIAMSAQILKKVLEPLNILDQVLVKCGQTITPVSDDIIKLNQAYNQQAITQGASNYKGFTLEIIEEPFSQTVTRRKAIAKNTQGIILVETPLSFTTLDQVLLDQVKFIIDSQNLKPN